ncbi:hypothetical protein LX16_1977 [Stackebrandtia albiflava]|uniref:Uncharacterized protein n=1 Tax=Stackebrandtia albiflava TaxID=406432 RepID=A0A562VEE7_9ACTN|nr:hypothetical protein [Stackebrandtia albiflava]TWJ16250.1 hypothetical protein LX16_1977 [Stackebrandtia albiflava]
MSHHTAPSAWDVARDLLRINLRYFLYVWALLYLITAGILTVVSVLGTPDVSVLDFASYAPRYWLLTTGIILTAACLRPYVAHGVTRRSFTWGGTWAALAVCGVILPAASAAAYLVEYLVFQANGWHYQIEGPHLFDHGGRWGLVFVEFAVVFTVHFFAGWVIASLFTRLSPFKALPSALPAFLPVVVAETAMGVSWGGRIWRVDLDLPLPETRVGVAVGVVMIGVLVVANRLLLKDAPIGCRTH